MSVWLVGAGPHAQEYAKVLSSLGVDFDVVGRGSHSAKTFEASTGKKVMTGGLISALQSHKAPVHAIVAVSFEQLASSAIALIQAGTRRILLEKPGSINVVERVCRKWLKVALKCLLLTVAGFMRPLQRHERWL